MTAVPGFVGVAMAEVGGLEASLLQIVQDHQHRSLGIREQTGISCPSRESNAYQRTSHIFAASLLTEDKAKKDALRIARKVSELLVDTVNGGVEESFIIEKCIELEIRALVSTIVRYKKQTDQWLAASHAMNSILKEIGDFENWMKTMDYDCKTINAAIRNIHKA